MSITVVMKSFDGFPTGQYVARIAKIEEESTKLGAQLKFTFELSRPANGDKSTLLGWVSGLFYPKSGLYEITQEAHGGAPIDRPFKISRDDVIGQPATIVVLEEKKDKRK